MQGHYSAPILESSRWDTFQHIETHWCRRIERSRTQVTITALIILCDTIQIVSSCACMCSYFACAIDWKYIFMFESAAHSEFDAYDIKRVAFCWWLHRRISSASMLPLGHLIVWISLLQQGILQISVKSGKPIVCSEPNVHETFHEKITA